MESDHVIEIFNLSGNETRVYLALLKLGPSSVLMIARESKLKRPTVYLILDELLKKGAVALVPQEKKKLFIALSPERIGEELERKTEEFKKTLPELLALWKTKTAKPVVKFFESKEGMLNVYREIVEDPSIKEVITFVSFEAIPEEFDENYGIFIKLFKEKRVRGRELISSHPSQHSYLEKVRRLPNYEVRMTPPDTRFSSDTIIYGNRVAILSFKKHFALIIESEDIADSFQSLFELAWEQGQRL